MRRLDWQLVKPDRAGSLVDTLPMATLIRRLVTREAAGEFSEGDRETLDQLEQDMEETGPSHCVAVGAPRVEDDPRWEPRVVDEYAAADIDMELDDYLDYRRKQPDCERCSYSSPYSLFPMDPCEFSAGALEALLTDRDLIARAAEPMDAVAMVAFAEALEKARDAGEFHDVADIDGKDYLTKAADFLRFWSDLGFGILPTDIDDVLGYPWEGALALVGRTTDGEDDEEPPVFH